MDLRWSVYRLKREGGDTRRVTIMMEVNIKGEGDFTQCPQGLGAEGERQKNEVPKNYRIYTRDQGAGN